MPRSSATDSQARFSNASVVWIASANVASPSAASACAAATIPRLTRSIGSGTPITPVEATATPLSGTPAAIAAGALHLGRVLESAARRWRRSRCPS